MTRSNNEQGWASILVQADNNLYEADCLNEEAAVLKEEATYASPDRAGPLRAEAEQVHAWAERIRDQAIASLSGEGEREGERVRSYEPEDESFDELKREFEILKIWFQALRAQRPVKLVDHQDFRLRAARYRARLRRFWGIARQA